MTFSIKTIFAGLAAFALVGAASTASAQYFGGHYSDSRVSIGFSTGPAFVSSYSYSSYCPPPRPVFVAPAPVYYAPRPVYVAPAPVYYAPRPVYVAPSYCPPPRRVYASYSWY